MVTLTFSRPVFTTAVKLAICGIIALKFVIESNNTKKARSMQAIRSNVANEWYESSLQTWEGWEMSRDQFFQEVDSEKCRFPKIYYRDNKKQGLNFKDGFRAMQRKWRYKKKMLNNTESVSLKHAKLVAAKNKFQRNITFVHIGKAGGTSVACNIWIARNNLKKNCPKKFPQPGQKESVLSRQVNCYTHYAYNRHCFDVNRSFLVNARNPIDRIASWYLYEHIDNLSVIHRDPDREYRCGQLMLYTCYRQLDHLVSVGLNGRRPSSKNELRVGTNLTEAECTEWAWAAVRGYVFADYHNAFNYDWYTNRVLDNSSNEVFVIRVEHLKKDWSTVDRMVGGSGALLPEMDSHANEAASKPLDAWNKTMSAAGIRNLCRALCNEIQTYKRLLYRAANLNDDDLRTSMDELRKVCPDETNMESSTCGH